MQSLPDTKMWLILLRTKAKLRHADGQCLPSAEGEAGWLQVTNNYPGPL